MSESEPQIATEEQTFCAAHPDRETSLRCNRCGRLMCAECAVLTPVGYRCRECVRQHDDRFFTASQNDYAALIGSAAALSALSTAIVAALGIPLLFVIFVAIPLGGAVSEVGLRLTAKRRGRYSAQVSAAGVVIGALIGGVIYVVLRVGALPPLEILWQIFFSDLRLLVFVGIVAAVVYGRFQTRI